MGGDETLAAGQAREGPPDQAARTAIIRERARNVVVVAGAGTGKTRTIIARAIELLAPTVPGAVPLAIARVAAITFTRRAAGELRFRLREQLLRELEHSVSAPGPRAAQLRGALGNLDAAFVGTIHGFADRLLRLRPVEAALSPAYALVEETADLIAEAVARVRRAAETGTLRSELGRAAAGLPPALIDEAGETVRIAVRTGLSIERGLSASASVETILTRMIDSRDIVLSPPELVDARLDEARAAAQRLAEMVQRMRGGARGHTQVRRMVRAFQRLHEIDDPADALRLVQEIHRGRPLQKRRDFADDNLGWSIYQALRPDGVKPGTLGDKLKGPYRWLATRLVRLAPVVQAMYERVKREHEVVDYLDLLIRLRNVLRDDRAARHFYQGLFDHILIDEFQDTDALQCEIVWLLGEHGAGTADWRAVSVAPGRLTVVGDPQQSIYRFRRADLAIYSEAVDRLTTDGALVVRLDTNYRSHASLIRFFNDQLRLVIEGQGTAPFDRNAGRANYMDLLPLSAATAARVVHVLPYAGPENAGLLAGGGRPIEAAMLARYLRWLLASRRLVRDPATAEVRPVVPSDIAVLVPVTTNVRLLLREFDHLGIAYVARGGALFLGHPAVRQFLLGLRALADRDDGVAEAALLRPPFFALDCADAAAGVLVKDADDPRKARITAARQMVADLRARRSLQAPGATARDLIERTGLGQAVVTGANGAQTLAILYEVAAEIDRRAAIERCDFDAVTELLRAWAERPMFLEVGPAIGAEALHVLTVHSAKGLEFPVVVLWDGFQTLSERSTTTWRADSGGQSWAINLGPVALEHPPGAQVLAREQVLGEHERRRLFYVAATRARDLLVVPVPTTIGRLPYAHAALVADVDDALVKRFDTFRPGTLPAWAQGPAQSLVPVVGDRERQEWLDDNRRRFQVAAERATRPLAVPRAVTAMASVEAAALAEAEGAGATRCDKERAGRFGAIFGGVVHRAVALELDDLRRPAADAVALAAGEAGLTVHLTEAEGDVQRTLDALQRIGVLGNDALEVATEYPLCVARAEGLLLSGIVDVLAVGPNTVWCLDLKTNAPPQGAVAAAFPEYLSQLRLYEELLRASGIVGSRELRLGLLLTATGAVHWM